MRGYIMYYEKQNVVSDEKEKINFAQGYLKDIAQHLFITQYLYTEKFLINHTQRIDTLKQFFAVLLYAFSDINHLERIKIE